MSPAPTRNDMARLNPSTMDMLRMIATKRRESIGDTLDRLALEAIRTEYAEIIREAASALATATEG